jgi:hypothetical protein
VDAPLTKTTGKVQANGQTAVALATPLITWLTSHFHQITVPSPGAATTPPVSPPTPDISSQNLFSS